MNHKEMNAELARLCGQLGVYCWINSGEIAQHGTGWVDAVAVGSRLLDRPAALFIENKTADGRRTRAQIRVGRMLLRAGLEYRLYRPADYDNGTVRQDLEAIA